MRCLWGLYPLSKLKQSSDNGAGFIHADMKQTFNTLAQRGVMVGLTQGHTVWRETPAAHVRDGTRKKSGHRAQTYP